MAHCAGARRRVGHALLLRRQGTVALHFAQSAVPLIVGDYNEIVVSVVARRRGDPMSELQDAGRMLEAAEQAAVADDLASADELLRTAARIQEAELGPLHPDLANTLNNLAIVAENAGRLGDAETFYRRAVAIASASLPVDHPMTAASRRNLEDFCRAYGLPIDTPATPPPTGPPTPVSPEPTPA